MRLLRLYLMPCLLLAAACGHKHDGDGDAAPAPPAASPTPVATPAAPTPPAPQAPEVDALSDPMPLTGWQQSWWQNKVTTTLLDQDLDHRADAAKLAGMDRRALVETLMKDPAFLDTVVRFNYYYLGFRRDSVRQQDGSFAFDLFAMPQAVSAAQ